MATSYCSANRIGLTPVPVRKIAV
uniref:Uncharacterized protein n=1 Tax=Anguilla anguilla TaxID=7936 RepID=A0A0E9XP46_ANGAN